VAFKACQGEESRLLRFSQDVPLQILDVVEAHNETPNHHVPISVNGHTRDVLRRHLLPPRENKLDRLISAGGVLFLPCCRAPAREGFCSP
jgi:hypothetical protein